MWRFLQKTKRSLQLGDPEEVDGVEDYEKSQTLINQSFPGNIVHGMKLRRHYGH